MEKNSKKYGLIIPKEAKGTKPTFQASRNVFGNDSDTEEEPNKKPVLLRPSDNTNRLAKVAQEKAVLEDPTVYQYDEIYDLMVSKKEDKIIKTKESQKPRYIENLMKSANKRKIENERRIERQIQKEREQEGDEFADKEVFVTSAYKKKLEEMQLEEEKEKREEYLESIGDVTKQRDLGGFYRHLYEQKLGTDEEPTVTNSKANTKDSEKDKKTSVPKDIIDKSKKRNYRKRNSSADIKNNLSDGEIEDSDEEEINRINIEDIKRAKRNKKDDENIDADSDFSIDESSEEESEAEKDIKVPKEVLEKVEKEPDTFRKPDSKSLDTSKEHAKINTDLPKEETKPKIDIWKKRTVGEMFEQALKRYYERKAARGS